MTVYIENSTRSAPIQRAAAKALGLESQQLAQETNPRAKSLLGSPEVQAFARNASWSQTSLEREEAATLSS
jgi:hypothetical protein